MKRQQFNYHLPSELIAQTPLAERSASRLLCLNKLNGEIDHRQFKDLLDCLNPNDLLVFNNTRVIPARMYARKATGGKVEIFLERILSEDECLVQLGASKSPKPGNIIHAGELQFEVLGRENDLYHLRLLNAELSILNCFEQQAEIPLPPYIERDVEDVDSQRYQTVFAEHKGAVAAPTAGLHFDQALLARIKQQGVQSCFVTLHVGAGTFQPVRVDDVAQHKMHSEWMQIDADTCELITATKSKGGRIIAVGTTAVRCLETAASQGELRAFTGDTDIFIYPGYNFKCIDALITNFHLPESTLLMLVSAFAGQANIMRAYQAAVELRYRFFSYGDAMFLYE